jgi:ribosome biogenesis GTPase / thiamine phosphate phosphatase
LKHIYGWTHERQQQFAPLFELGLVPARVIAQQRQRWHLVTFDGMACDAQISGKLRHNANAGEFPVVGDWVGIDAHTATPRIQVILARHGTFVRKAAGEAHVPQVVGANIDLALLVCSLNEDFSPRRLERYLALCHACSIPAVIVLTKADLVRDLTSFLEALEQVASGITILSVSALNGDGLPALKKWLAPGSTAALLGSSGAGKSTLVNALAEAELMQTAAIRDTDGRGRHTTTHRELILLPNGALILDSPGMRELGLWEASSGLDATFTDVEELTQRCRFSDCQHHGEPDCAIAKALSTGELDQKRWKSFLKLTGELAYEKAKHDPVLKAENKKLWKKRNANFVAQLRMRDRFNE